MPDPVQPSLDEGMRAKWLSAGYFGLPGICFEGPNPTSADQLAVSCCCESNPICLRRVPH
jgi:hypothetical protein